MYYLLIDPLHTQDAQVSLLSDSQVISSVPIESDAVISDVLLAYVDVVLEDAHVDIKEVKGIFCDVGPGGFTTTRLGASCANALAFALDIPVMGYEYDEKTLPVDAAFSFMADIKNASGFQGVTLKYHLEPNITKPKPLF